MRAPLAGQCTLPSYHPSSQDYARADDILDELLDDYGVVLVDQDYTWRYVGRGHDGMYGEGGSYGRRADDAALLKPGAMGSHDYVRDQPTGEVVDCDEATQAKIDALLAERLARKKARKFTEADALQFELFETYGVEVDDRARTWYLVA